MLHITLGPKKPADPDDGLGRRFVGYEEGMTPDALYEASRGEWAIGAKRQNERYALFSFDGTVVQALEIDHLLPTRTFVRSTEEKRSDRYTIHGRVLVEGDLVFDKYVGHDSPVGPARNPVGYFADEDFDHENPCRCGCTGTTMRGDFLPGHDQIAIHERISRVGSVAEFVDWMDSVRPEYEFPGSRTAKDRIQAKSLWKEA